LRALAETSQLNRVEIGDRKLGFVVSGVAYHYVKENFPAASYLKLGFVWPLCVEKIRAFAGQVDELMVVEELDPFLETLIRAEGIKVRGKHPSYRLGELKPELIADLVAGKPKDEPARPMRPPQLCKGCPHRLTFNALKELGLFVSGDIGCYTLGTLPPFNALHLCLCMGAGITAAEGLHRAHAAGGKVVGVVGDSTFVHSGITGLINAAYNRAKGLILILDNSITAMTGGQDHPGTGKTITGQPTKQLSLEAICRACGADNVDVIKPQDYKAMLALIKERAEQDALSVIIVRAPCMLLR
jgi:indolepyruvate ferredoxin oxidoreductase alpha subunit